MAVQHSAPNQAYIKFEQEFAKRAQTWNPGKWRGMEVESSPEYITIRGVSNDSIIEEIQVKNPFFGMPKYSSLTTSLSGPFKDFDNNSFLQNWTTITRKVSILNKNIKKTKIEMNKLDNYCKPFIAVALGVVFIALSIFLFPAGLKAAGSALTLGGIACLALIRRSYSNNLQELEQECIKNKSLLAAAKKQPMYHKWIQKNELDFHDQNKSHLQTKALKFIAQQCRNNCKGTLSEEQVEFLRMVEFDRSKDLYYSHPQTHRDQDNLIEIVFENTLEED